MLGIHVFEKYRIEEYDEILFASTLLSVLSWKKFHGPVHLYTNSFFLEEMKKRGIDRHYEKIDIEFIPSKSDRVDKNTYWSWNKMRLIPELDGPFVLIDNDLWISDSLEFDTTKTFMAYHKEYIHYDIETKNFPDFDFMIPFDFVGRWKKWIMPMNTALLYVNGNKKFFKNWIRHAKIIAENSPDREGLKNPSVKTIFIEQRLLPMMAYEQDIDCSTFIPQIYNSHKSGANDESEWTPMISAWDDVMKEKFGKIHHIWGLKNHFDNKEIREYIIRSIISHLEEYSEEKEALNMIEKIRDLLETEEEVVHKN